jgi:hypothetical protein
MAITIGNKTNSNQNPNGTSQTLAHNMSAGANGTLLVVLTMANTVNVNSATYGGVAMTLVRNDNFTVESQRVSAWVLTSPPTGTNNIVISFSGSQFNSTSIFAVSLLGSNGLDVSGGTGPLATPNSQSLTILANSVIYATGISSSAQNTGYSIGGSTRTFEFNHNTNRVVRGCLSATNLSAGATNVSTITDFGNITNVRIAIKEFVSVSGRRRFILV